MFPVFISSKSLAKDYRQVFLKRWCDGRKKEKVGKRIKKNVVCVGKQSRRGRIEKERMKKKKETETETETEEEEAKLVQAINKGDSEGKLRTG